MMLFLQGVTWLTNFPINHVTHVYKSNDWASRPYDPSWAPRSTGYKRNPWTVNWPKCAKTTCVLCLGRLVYLMLCAPHLTFLAWLFRYVIRPLVSVILICTWNTDARTSSVYVNAGQLGYYVWEQLLENAVQKCWHAFVYSYSINTSPFQGNLLKKWNK